LSDIPSVRSQAGMSEIKIYNGKPELMPVTMQISIRRLKQSLRRI
jgi:hypothetical protein